MRFYPEVPSRRVGTLSRDLVTALLVVLLALVGLQVRSAVNELSVLGQGVHDAGASVQTGFDSAADAVDGTPLVGDDLARGLRDAGQGSGGNVADLGSAGKEKTHRLADLLGLLVFLLPTLFLLAQVLPDRVSLARRLTAASAVLGEPETSERRRLVAMRAAFSLPYGELLRFTRDPLGDLEAGRHDALVAAAFDDVGLRPPAR